MEHPREDSKRMHKLALLIVRQIPYPQDPPGTETAQSSLSTLLLEKGV